MDLFISHGPARIKLQQLLSRQASFPMNEFFKVKEDKADEESPILDLELVVEKLTSLDKEKCYWCIEGCCIGDTQTTPFMAFYDSVRENGYLTIRPLCSTSFD